MRNSTRYNSKKKMWTDPLQIFFERLWYRTPPTLIAKLFLPFTALYLLFSFLRKQAYKKKIFSVYRSPVPVIVVGNLTVGGSGKTPCVIALANFLKAAGMSPGIISRGYGGKPGHYPIEVTTNSFASEVGDEPLLIAKKTKIPVFVHPKRANAAQALLKKYPTTDLLISDDGLQHFALARDIEILLIQRKKNFGNGFCLPAGPLREPRTKLNQVDFVLENIQEEKAQEISPRCMYTKIEEAYQLIDTTRIVSLEKFQREKALHAFAGIAHPEIFFQQLAEKNFLVTPHPKKDHHKFSIQDFASLPQDAIIFLTEKDAVKCLPFADARMWVVPLNAVLDSTFLEKLLNKIEDVQKHF